MTTQTKVLIVLATILLIGIIYSYSLPKQNDEVQTVSEESITEVTQTEQPAAESTPAVPETTAQPQQVQEQAPAPTTVTSVPKTTTPSTPTVPVKVSIPTISKEVMKKYWDLIDTSLLAITLNQVDLYNNINAKKIVCDPETYSCKEKMKTQYDIYNNINRDSFVYGWEDAKQAILSTDIYKTVVRGYTHYAKDFLYFYTNSEGKRMILSYHTESLETDSLVEATLMFTDTDFDGLGTIREKCETPYRNDPTCFVSNPDIRDTDGDGLWDGTEVYL